jgi:hypothetical protein
MATIPWIQSGEKSVGQNSPTGLPLTDDRPLRYILTVLGIDPDGAFSSAVFGAVLGVVTTVIATGSTVARLLSDRFAEKINVKDYGAVGDGITDDTAAINAALAAVPTTPNSMLGAYVFFPPGEYLISSQIVLTKAGTRFGGYVGGQTATKVTSLKAASGFTGSMLLIQVGPGSKGAYVKQLVIDGNSEAGVTAGLELHANTLAKSTYDDLQMVNCGVGILTNDNCQSAVFTRVYANVGLTIGMDIGTGNRSMSCYECVLGGSTAAVRVGADNATAGDVADVIKFFGGEYYGQGAITGAAVQLRNCRNVSFFAPWFELSGTGTPTALVQCGTATATASTPHIFGGQAQCNSKAAYGVEVVQVSNGCWLDCRALSPTSGDGVKLTYATSRAVVLNTTTDVTTGLAWLVNGATMYLQGLTVLGKLITVLSATGGAGFNLPHGAAPTSPVDGDVWTTTTGLFVPVNGATKTVTLT